MAGLFEELKRRKVIRVLIAYVVTAWLLLQVAELLASILDLPEWADKLVFFLLAIGLVPALILAWAYELTPDGVKRDDGTASPTSGGRTALFLSVIGVFAVIVGAGVWVSGADARWVRDVALPELESDVTNGQWESAFLRAREISTRLPDTDLLDDAWEQFAWRLSMRTEPDGATVYRRPYDDPDAEWVELGTSPLHDVPVPKGYSLIRVEKEGYPPLFRTLGGMPIVGGERHMSDITDATGSEYVIVALDMVIDQSPPEGMVRVPGGELSISSDSQPVEAFYIDRYEVTNEQYSEFVRAGGYEREDLWEHDIIVDGDTLPWDAAMQRFVDSTGRPGPASWIGGTFPEDRNDFPVGGLSWYEAAAYARFVGKELPTLHHWRQAHANAGNTWQLPASNLENEGPAPVGQFQGIGWTGTYDMLGNVREWCANSLGENKVIVGGSWYDVPYAPLQTLDDPAIMPPLDRSAENGIRLVITNDNRRARESLLQPIEPEKPVVAIESASDEAFDVLRRQFQYSDAPLNASIDRQFERQGLKVEQVSLDNGEGGRTEVLIYLPDTDNSRHPTMLYWPSSLAIVLDSLDNYSLHTSFMVRSGWAVAMPIFENTFHRKEGQFPSSATIPGRDLRVRHVRELRRIMDYLETRPDIDSSAFAYYGMSWGSTLAPLPLAVDDRIAAAILNQAGIRQGRMYEVDEVHYLPRVTQPVLQFSGRYDTNFRYEDSSRPFFEMLGSEHKKHVVEPTGHFVSHKAIVAETLAWLDEHMPRD